MARLYVELLYKTPDAWAEVALAHLPEFLQDHARCEQKASANALGLVTRYPYRTEMMAPLIQLAQEELDHFRQVFEIMAARGIPLAMQAPDPYAAELLTLGRHGKEERFLDRLLVAALIEARSAERLRLITRAVADPQLVAFYRELWTSEARHAPLFVELAQLYFADEVVEKRLAELIEAESLIIQKQVWGGTVH